MAHSTSDLSELFGAALQSVTAKRQELNAMDEHNHDHGDNMVENLRVITDTLRSDRSQPPARALRDAGQKLKARGRGGSREYYAQGLERAAERVEGRSALENEDVVGLVESILGTVPARGARQTGGPAGSVLDGLAQRAGQPPGAARPDEDAGDLGDILEAALPAGLAFLQSKQAGEDTLSAAGQALTALLGGRTDPLQTGTHRTAAGGLVAQSILRSLAGRR